LGRRNPPRRLPLRSRHTSGAHSEGRFGKHDFAYLPEEDGRLSPPGEGADPDIPPATIPALGNQLDCTARDQHVLYVKRQARLSYHWMQRKKREPLLKLRHALSAAGAKVYDQLPRKTCPIR
jgi:hypothetical protein